MTWTAYDDPDVARKMTANALTELGRWVCGDHEFHQPWKVFCEFMDYIGQRQSISDNTGRIADFGCAAGYYRVILNLHLPNSVWQWYYGIERSRPLRELSMIFEPSHSLIFEPSRSFVTADSLYYDAHLFDLVLSGSMLQHEEHWEQALAEQMRVCRRWLIIHKIPIRSFNGLTKHSEVSHHKKMAYGVEMDEWHFPVEIINDKVGRRPVKEHYFHNDPPHWSGLYDLSTL